MDTRTDLIVLRTAEAQVDRYDRVSMALHWVTVLLIQPLSGLADAIFHGRPFVLFGFAVPPLVERDRALSHLAGEMHEYAGYVLIGLIGLIVLHVLAALTHSLILRDGAGPDAALRP